MKFVRIGPNDSTKYDELIERQPAFVKIHSPNCGHCVNMKEAWDTLEDSQDIKHYDIAIIEVHEGATNNIHSLSGKINEGLPTIRAVQLNGKKWKEYEGDRSVEDMVKFIKKNFTDKMNNNKMNNNKSKKHKKIMSGGKHLLKKRSGRSTKRKGTKRKGTKRRSKRKPYSKSKMGRKY
jgi:hypothetical protein